MSSSQLQQHNLEHSPETGVTLLEYVISIALLALVMLAAMPNTEQAVESRIVAGSELWSSWNIEI